MPRPSDALPRAPARRRRPDRRRHQSPGRPSDRTGALFVFRPVITSPHNDSLTQVRKLAGRKWRDKLGEFVAEGEDLIAAADAAGWVPSMVLSAAGSGLEGEEVAPPLLARVSQLGSGTRALAVYPQRWAPEAVGPVCVALWGVGDPGNVGTVLRSALAFGAGSVALGPGSADPYGHKAVRASMGAIFSVPVVRVRGDDELPGRRGALAAGGGRPRGEVEGGGGTVGVGAGLRGVAELPPEERGKVGKAANQARGAIEALIGRRREEVDREELDARLAADVVDVTLPASPAQPVGRLHLLTHTRRELEDIFVGLGFRVVEGPEVDTVAYNFDGLNHDITHPARQWSDTFYVDDDIVLRTHTSPMQVRSMMEQPPPLYIVIPGACFRRDNDATHTPQFHQVEGLAVDEDITLADLKGTLLAFAQGVFGDERQVRFRPHFFPFTEPSVELDVDCFNCNGGFLRDGSRCPLCKGEGWIELLGAGEVDPNVFEYVREYGYDPERHQGFAWGMGIERIAALKYGVPDIRLLYDNDLRFLEQFG